MKRFFLLTAIETALLGAPYAAKAQPEQLPEPLLMQDFEQTQDLTTWGTLGDGVKVSPETAPQNIKSGHGALRCDYRITSGQISVVGMPLAPRSLATLQSISFWVKADHTTSFVFALGEQGGGRFGMVFSVVKDQWQHVEIAPSELLLQTGKDDPKDANGALDLDKIDSASLADFNQIFVGLSAQNPPLAHLLGLESGARTFDVDDLFLSSQPFPATPRGALLDDFNHPQANWVSVGNVELQTARPAPPEKTGVLQIVYTQTSDRLSAVLKPLAPGTLRSKEQLSLDIASKRSATLLVQLEETSGGKYNAQLHVEGGDTIASKTLFFADFTPSDDSKDDDHRLDLDQVKQLMLMDVSGALGTGTGKNTLRISQLRVK